MASTPTKTVSPLARACSVADAILYEGYLLYPYRRSSAKNRVRWQFGVLAPRLWIEAQRTGPETVAGSAEGWHQHSECLLEGSPSTEFRILVRFLQLQVKAVERVVPGGGFEPVDQLSVGDSIHLSFEEAVPRQVESTARLAELLDGERSIDFEIPGGEDIEVVHDRSGNPVGRVIRRRRALGGTLRLSAEAVPAPFPLVRLTTQVENTDSSTDPQTPRGRALSVSMIAAHSLVELEGGSFLSLLDPPEWASAAAKGCTNVRAFPVLAGPGDDRHLVLSSPIILYDHPRVAPESPGDLFDAGEIDEILSLRILTLSDEEKREARATDPRAAAILDRVGAMAPDVLSGLHGTWRGDGEPDGLGERDDLGERDAPATSPLPWWDPGADASVSPSTDSIVVAGTSVARGSRVRLHPRRRGTDAHDMFLAGRTASVEAVLLDVDGSRHVAVTLEDDPGAELHQWYGRFRYFLPEEIEPMEL